MSTILESGDHFHHFGGLHHLCLHSPTSKETQTKPITGVTKEIQHLPDYSEKWTNTETSLTSSENTAESFTPPGSPPRYTPPGSPFRVTKTTPRFWRERIYSPPRDKITNSPFQG